MISSASLSAFSIPVRPGGTSAPVQTVRLPPTLSLRPGSASTSPAKPEAPAQGTAPAPSPNLPRGSLLNLTV